MMKRICLFPQILNVIDIELAEANCLDCKKYIDRRVLSTKSTLEGKTLHERRTTMASEISQSAKMKLTGNDLTHSQKADSLGILMS